ncbi:uncharacterized protein LOC110707198 [Chenopodium quinoa]|uniref:uncharacterized protein LOC110707198 n=1 Tax=Chenopodium quinoa TaxID=63459 RepID=UPI000B79380C|nr:uncharacterized protein LOC110707198 [Chenopodium quinoa]
MEALPKISVLVCCIFFLFLKPSQSATLCNPNDLKVLLQMKNYFHNGPTFSEWNPKTDCCNWNDIKRNYIISSLNKVTKTDVNVVEPQKQANWYNSGELWIIQECSNSPSVGQQIIRNHSTVVRPRKFDNLRSIWPVALTVH